MNAQVPPRGGVAVGHIDELDRLGADAVRCLRLWGNGPASQAQVWNDFATRLGPDQGRAALQGFERLFDLCATFSRRPLMRHQVGCRCLGGDESAFATFITAAADGDRDDALLIAMTLVRADVAPMLVGLGQTVGLALRRMDLRARSSDPEARPRILH